MKKKKDKMNKITFITLKTLLFLFKRTRAYDNPLLSRLFWDIRAKDLDVGRETRRGDFGVVEDIIRTYDVKRLLDVGCGSGRLFPAYKNTDVEEVVGQEISQDSLDLAVIRHDCKNIRLVNSTVPDLDFADDYFDLVISNRVLQHIPDSALEEVVKRMCDLGKLVYINEFADTDAGIPGVYLFKHDYKKLFNKFGFKEKDRGYLDKQTWVLYSKAQS